MGPKGFTLIEVVVAICIMGILLSIALPQFNDMNRNAAIDSQTRMLAADLMTERSRALYEKKARTVVVTGNGFSAYSSTYLSVSPVSSKTFRKPVTPATLQLTFDEWGGITIDGDASVPDSAICVQASNTAGTDSVVISRSRIQSGKKTAAGCSSANIEIR